MEHRLDPSLTTLHGVWSRTIRPAIEAASGDTVRLSTLDAWWSRESFGEPFGERARVEHPDVDRGHALIGPIAITGAEPRDAVEIQFLKLRPAAHGFTVAGGYPSLHYAPFGADGGEPTMLLWEIDAVAKVAVTQVSGRVVRVPIAPFLGVVGLAPDSVGELSTTPPRRTGGNLDCQLLTEGTSLFLPVEVPGGLLSVGDGHAAQGDGEVSNNGIECAMKEVVLRVVLHQQMKLKVPIARTRAGWVTLGLGETLDAAAISATNAMLDLMQRQLGCTRVEALGLASVSVNLHITQIVNGTKGVHAVWPVES